MTPEMEQLERERFDIWWVTDILDTLDDAEKDDSFAYDLAWSAWIARARLDKTEAE